MGPMGRDVDPGGGIEGPRAEMARHATVAVGVVVCSAVALSAGGVAVAVLAVFVIAMGNVNVAVPCACKGMIPHNRLTGGGAGVNMPLVW
jgi:hypothetical protein